MVPSLYQQVSRTGRVRCPPLAFWANQRLCRTGNAIELGFSDTIAQACQGEPERPQPPVLSRKREAGQQKDGRTVPKRPDRVWC